MKLQSYVLGDTVVQYLIAEDGKTSIQLIPQGKESRVAENWKAVSAFWENPNGPLPNPRADYNKQWLMGSLAHVHLRGQWQSTSQGATMKYAQSINELKFADQTVCEKDGATVITTTLRAEAGYRLTHTLSYRAEERGFRVNTVFGNESDKPLTVDMLTAFSLDNLSPFADDEQPERLRLHRFLGGWALEGRHIVDYAEEVGVEKAWQCGQHPSLRFGSLGSFPTISYFPMAVVEDTAENVFWAASIANNASWQMELNRRSDTVSLSGGYADAEYGHWWKTVAPGEELPSPEAFVAASAVDWEDACQRVTFLYNRACDQYGEREPFCTQFNEYCTTWGKPTQEKMLTFARKLKDHGFRYAVIDAGWTDSGMEQGGNGTWKVNKEIFPDMPGMCREMREMGIIPGIWFEMEVTTAGSPLYESAYDDQKLHRDGVVICSAGHRTFWDLRRPEVADALAERVIGMLRENGFGYIKVDYNGSIGYGVDGADSPGEGLYEQARAIREFFLRMKREIPDLIIENCASGGHRLEPSMMGISALSSFSDAHECKEIPYVAANLHNLMLPRQESIWAVVHHEDDDQRFIYSLAAAFFGRLSLSGTIMELSDAQWALIDEATAYYSRLHGILLNGVTRIYGNRSISMRQACGTQVAVRKNADEMLVIAHAFKHPGGTVTVDIPTGFEVKAAFHADTMSVAGGKLTVAPMAAYSAGSILLGKKN